MGNLFNCNLGSGWGLRVQIPAFRRAGLEVAAVYSRSQEKAEESAKKFNVPSGKPNYNPN